MGREPRLHGEWSSDVTDSMTIAANRGRGAAAGMMTGAWIVVQVFQTPYSGRVAQVGESGSSADSLQGSGEAVFCVYGWCRTQ